MYQLPPRRASEPYNPALLPIDERLCQLLAERKKTAGEHAGSPDQDQIEKWAEQFNLSPDWLQLFFSRLEYQEPPEPFLMPANLRSVVPLMKNTEQGEYIYTLTHMMQYENASVVHLEIGMKQPDPYLHMGHAQINLTVADSDSYQVRMQRSGSRPTKINMEFTVSPPLPDDLSGINFGLVPYKRERPKEQEIVLDNPVVFAE